MLCPHCSQVHPAEALFCPKTGQKILAKQLCPNCGQEVQPSWKMCAFCGQKLSTEIGPAQAKTKQKGKRGMGIILTCGTIALLLVGAVIVIGFMYRDELGSMFKPLRASPILSSPTLTPTAEPVVESEIPSMPEAATISTPAIITATATVTAEAESRRATATAQARSDSATAIAQATLQTQTASIAINGNSANYNLGFSIAASMDINQDGIPDFVLGAAGSNNVSGHAYVISGKNRNPILTFFENEASDMLGYSVSPIGDLNNDGITDFIVSSPRDYIRRVYIYSGSNGAKIFTISGSAYSNDTWDTFGYSVANAGDVNADGIDDIIVGAPYSDPDGRNDAGIAYVFSGANNSLLYCLKGGFPYDFLGGSVSTAGDINADGHADVLVGAPSVPTNGPTNRPGSVHIFSGATGKELLSPLTGENPNDEFGWSVATMRDINNDSVPDFIIGTRPLDTGRPGKAYVFSGFDGARLFDFTGDSAEDYFGFSVASAGDLDLDGKSDFLIGAPWADPDGRINAGSIFAYSSRNGRLLFRFDGESAEDHMGYAVSGIGDIDSDGVAEVIVGAPYADSQGQQDSGIVYILDFNATLPRNDTPVVPTSTSAYSPSAYLMSNTSIAYCQWDVRISLSGFAPNRSITVTSSYTEKVCATGNTVSSSWTQEYPTKTDENGNLILAFLHKGTGSYNYTFIDEMSNQTTLSFLTSP